MEFGSLGLGTQSQLATGQTNASSPGQTGSSDVNPQQAVVPVDSIAGGQNDRRQDLLGREQPPAGESSERSSDTPDELQATSRRTTLNFDSEQNRIFLEVVDTTTDEVIEQIPSEKFVEFVDRALNPGGSSAAEEEESENAETARAELAI